MVFLLYFIAGPYAHSPEYGNRRAPTLYGMLQQKTGYGSRQ
jgi:hypothetical protein